MRIFAGINASGMAHIVNNLASDSDSFMSWLFSLLCIVFVYQLHKIVMVLWSIWHKSC